MADRAMEMQAALGKTSRGFEDLPREIRDEIWSLVLRDKRLGVHFFTVVFDPDSFPKNLDECFFYGHESSLSQGGWYNFIFAQAKASSRPSSAKFLCPTPVASKYLQDSGLWTACRESRQHVMKHHSRFPKSATQETIPPAKHTRTDSMIHGYHLKGGERQYISVQDHDLVVFQPDEFRRMEFETSLPLIYSRCVPGNCIQHLGFEIDPQWRAPTQYDFRDGRRCDNTNAMALVRAKASTVPMTWLIDYRIKRKCNHPQALIRRDRHVFRGNGCRFVEVRRNDEEWELEGGHPLFAAASRVESMENCSSAFHLIRLMEICSRVLEMPYFGPGSDGKTTEAYEEWEWEDQFERDMTYEDYLDFYGESTGLRQWDCSKKEFEWTFFRLSKLGVLAYESIED